MKCTHQSDKTLAKLSPRLKKYAELLATGLHSKLQAAIKAGFTPGTSDKTSYRWIGDTREDSFYPHLYDYYEKLNIKNLRKFEAKTESITRELGLIAFSDVSRFIDLPSETYEDKCILAKKVQTAHFIQEQYEAYRQDKVTHDQDKRRKKPIHAVAPSPEQIKLLTWFKFELAEKEQHDLMFWTGYSRGSIRLKNREEIPAELLPCIAEISETREGIRVKLHDKMKALDMLAKIMKLYDADKGDGEAVSKIQSVNIFVNGSKSTLLLDEPE